jgi:hypothetical protein
MGVAFGQTGKLRGIEAGIHAGENGEMPRGWHGELLLIAEIRGVLMIGGKHFLKNVAHNIS